MHCTDWLVKMNFISHGNDLTVYVTSIKPNTAKAVVRHFSLCFDICLKYLQRKFLRQKNTELVLPVERKSKAGSDARIDSLILLYQSDCY
jgi:hypothetical protein